MSLKQRLEALEATVSDYAGACSTCGGRHCRNWVDLMQAAQAAVLVCLCRPCCAWVADMEGAAGGSDHSPQVAQLHSAKRTVRHTATQPQ